nr:SUMF1/EgtB/PvdO family nonheme iron enzyme [uncultured Rhodopila sp.]
MTLTPEQSHILAQLKAARDASFGELVRIAGLDKRSDFVGANLRGVDFGTTDLADYNFARADLSHADMTRASGKDRLMLIDATTTGALGLPGPGELRDRPGLPAMVRIPAGTFTMGVPAEENQREGVPESWAARSAPLQTVAIARPFWLGRYPVTRGQFAAFVAAKDYSTPDEAYTYEPDDKGEWDYMLRKDRGWRNPGFEQTDDHPVVCVSHADAEAYVAWLRELTGKAYRLPSEAEWEYACRAGTTTARFWGDGREEAVRYAKVADRSLMARMKAEFDPERYFDGDSGIPFTAPVGSFRPNPFGLYDMLGNVWEWTADCWNDNLKDIPLDGTARTTGDCKLRVVRGGSWNNSPRSVRAGYRDWLNTGYRGTSTGFRVARTLLVLSLIIFTS